MFLIVWLAAVFVRRYQILLLWIGAYWCLSLFLLMGDHRWSRASLLGIILGVALSLVPPTLIWLLMRWIRAKSRNPDSPAITRSAEDAD